MLTAPKKESVLMALIAPHGCLDLSRVPADITNRMLHMECSISFHVSRTICAKSEAKKKKKSKITFGQKGVGFVAQKKNVECFFIAHPVTLHMKQKAEFLHGPPRCPSASLALGC